LDAEAASGKQTVYPEYLPARGVMVSAALIRIYGHWDLLRALEETGVSEVSVLGGTDFELSVFKTRELETQRRVRLVSLSNIGSLTVWARDWAPLTALRTTSDGRSESVLLDFNYYQKRPADEMVPRVFAKALGMSRVSVPVYNEGGNFMVNEDGLCLMSSRVTEANSAAVAGRFDVVMDDHAIDAQYRALAGCKRTRIFPRMPSEGTGHIDMWAKFLNNNTVLVNQLEPATAQTDSSFSDNLQAIHAYLEARVADLQAMGLTVVRIPMPLPLAGMTRSYTNSLLLNGTALVPVYRNPAPDQDLFGDYERRVKAAYEAAGFKFVPILSDSMIAQGGAVHCVTMQYGMMP
jgi:agmatine/peptidylarginine deiminase